MSKQKIRIMAQLFGLAPLAVCLTTPFAQAAEPSQGSTSANAHTILPDTAATILLSNRDVNRIVCLGGKIEGYQYSEEKGAIVSNAGAQAFIKFQFEEIGDQVNHVTVRNEFYFICGGITYTLLAEPRDIIAQTVFLAPGSGVNAGANAAMFNALPEEDRAVSISLSMLKDELPESFSVREFADPYVHLQNPKVDVRVRREVLIEGTPYSAKEFLLRARTRVELNEAMFAHTRFGASIFAITLDRLALEAGEIGRLLIVYRASPAGRPTEGRRGS